MIKDEKGDKDSKKKVWKGHLESTNYRTDVISISMNVTESDIGYII